jgi:DNA-directed RNA polymerase subunit K/omega
MDSYFESDSDKEVEKDKEYDSDENNDRNDVFESDNESVLSIGSDDSEKSDEFELDKNIGLAKGNTEKHSLIDDEDMQDYNEEIVNEEFDVSSDEEDETYLQKFNKDVNRNYIAENHPECIVHNNHEIEALSSVTRDETNAIIDESHKSMPILTKYERTRIIGQRAKQINQGARPFVDIPEGVIDGYIIAEMELREKKIPFIIQRPMPNGSKEFWKLEDLEQVDF